MTATTLGSRHLLSTYFPFDIDPSPVMNDEAIFEALTGVDWTLVNLKIASEEEPTQDDPATLSDLGLRRPRKVETLGRVRRTQPLKLANSLLSQSSLMNRKGNGHDSLPRFGPPCGVKPYSRFVVDLPRGAEEELA